jgi:DNA helicase-2/ATP-dependent DNA helicase PcrA
MPAADITIQKLWATQDFKPNKAQKDAILHTGGPLFLTAGPGSGKTRVLLWRTLNLIVFHGVKPKEIFLSTFTEKAALQLKEGLRFLLGLASNYTQQPYDISKMALGTVHSICQQMLSNRDFSPHRERRHPPILLDELGQYFKIYNKGRWTNLCEAAGWDVVETAIFEINDYIGKSTQAYGPSTSRHEAVTAVISLFNRFSEETLDPKKCKTKNKTLKKLLKMYEAYQESLVLNPIQKQVDFSLLQKAAYEEITGYSGSDSIYKHIIIDEYQDTNAIQEKIFFALAKGHKNICVVGDDDQALYRFRGATVENLVDFEKRCENAIGVKPRRIDLDTNYRSRKRIVDSYTSFIKKTNWKKDGTKNEYYRIHDKNIHADSTDKDVSVVCTSPNPNKEEVNQEVIRLIYNLKKSGKITDYNQCAFLFPAMKNNTRVKDFAEAITSFNEKNGLTDTDDEIRYYAPRAGRFLDTDEAKAIWGLFMLIFERPHYQQPVHGSLQEFQNWIHECEGFARELCGEDVALKQVVADKKAELALVLSDYAILLKAIEEMGLEIAKPFPSVQIKSLYNTTGISTKAKRNLGNTYFYRILAKREKDGNPFSVAYILNRATSIDWSILDLFYQLNGFDYFREMYAKAEKGIDEGPICNLGLITQYLSKFMEDRGTVITASYLDEDKFINTFFGSFTFALFRLGESEYEDADDPFPKGRLPFLTIHQSKGLEFPVVVLGSPDRRKREADIKEIIIRELLKDKDAEAGGSMEPLDRIPTFDNMRMFYVALSRAKNLLILPRFGRGKQIPPTSYYETEEFTAFFDESNFPTIPHLKIDTIPEEKAKKDDMGKSYSYTSDFLFYNKCPRQYMVLRKYGFVSSSSETMLFGSLIHETIEDLHNLLLSERNANEHLSDERSAQA